MTYNKKYAAPKAGKKKVVASASASDDELHGAPDKLPSPAVLAFLTVLMGGKADEDATENAIRVYVHAYRTVQKASRFQPKNLPLAPVKPRFMKRIFTSSFLCEGKSLDDCIADLHQASAITLTDALGSWGISNIDTLQNLLTWDYVRQGEAQEDAIKCAALDIRMLNSQGVTRNKLQMIAQLKVEKNAEKGRKSRLHATKPSTQ